MRSSLQDAQDKRIAFYQSQTNKIIERDIEIAKLKRDVQFYKHQMELLSKALLKIHQEKQRPSRALGLAPVGRPKKVYTQKTKEIHPPSFADIVTPVIAKEKYIKPVKNKGGRPAGVKETKERKPETYKFGTPYRPDPEAPALIRPSAEYDSVNSYDAIMKKYSED